jgi:hypothetical protein
MRKYIIFDVSELNKINFNEVLEDSQSTLRYSLDGTKTFIKWEDIEPSFLSNLLTKSRIYTLVEISEILLTSEWFDVSAYIPN